MKLSNTFSPIAGSSLLLLSLFPMCWINAGVVEIKVAGIGDTTGHLPPTFRRGDANSSGEVDMTDALTTLGSLFLGNARIACADAADADDNGELTIADAVLTLNFLFAGREGIAAPGPRLCGFDSTDDVLDCGVSTGCGTKAAAPPPQDDVQPLAQAAARIGRADGIVTSYSTTPAFFFRANVAR